MLKCVSCLVVVTVLAGPAVETPEAGPFERTPERPLNRVETWRPEVDAQDAGRADPAEVAALVKAATTKFKKPEVLDLIGQLQAAVREQVPEYVGDVGWIATTRTLAARLATPVESIPNEFGPTRTASPKNGKPPPASAGELFRPRTVLYRFGNRDFQFLPDEYRKAKVLAVKDIPPADQLTWLLSGHTPEMELAAAAISRELDVDRSRDKLSRFLEYWRNGPESFYQALDRTAGSDERVFYYDAMLGEFVARVAPELGKASSLKEKHDRLHTAFLTLRDYRAFIEAMSIALVSTEPLPVRLSDYEYSVDPSSARVRDVVELIVASNRGDLVESIRELREFLSAHPMPEQLWGKFAPSTFLVGWCQENAAKLKARLRTAEPRIPDLPIHEVTLRCRKLRQETQAKIRSVAREFLKERGVALKK